jgi:ribonuclease HII
MVMIGVDEAGRGPLAGPVCAAAVILDATQPIDGLTDSKKISERKRQSLAAIIKSQSRAYGVGWADVAEIDELNILRATFLAMARAVEACIKQLTSPTDVDLAKRMIASHEYHVQVDGNHSPADFTGPWQWPYVTTTIIKGDLTEPAISAASILAKTARDAHMDHLHEAYPHYGFAQHRGYGTAAHLRSLAAHGPCAAHRKSFAPVAAFYS